MCSSVESPIKDFGILNSSFGRLDVLSDKLEYLKLNHGDIDPPRYFLFIVTIS